MIGKKRERFIRATARLIILTSAHADELGTLERGDYWKITDSIFDMVTEAGGQRAMFEAIDLAQKLQSKMRDRTKKNDGKLDLSGIQSIEINVPSGMIRCKECIYRGTETCPMRYDTDDDAFCWLGEAAEPFSGLDRRREDD